MQQQVRTIFVLDEYKLMPCLPLKTGTTNWQRSLISLLYVNDGNPTLDPSDVAEVCRRSLRMLTLRRLTSQNVDLELFF